jgi:ribonuclease BN (tRNA processing enzyme)
VKLTLFGTRGSVGRAGVETVRYGGDTSSALVMDGAGECLLLDAGSGISHVEDHLSDGVRRLDILLSHLHMDHIQGLGFFRPLFDPDVEVHLWGPASPTMGLAERLARYLSPPLFPVRLRELPGVVLHDIVPGRFEVGPFVVVADLISHPGPTLGFRIEHDGVAMAYLSDHEPALGVDFPGPEKWTSGYDLAMGADLLVHDAQYTVAEYPSRAGWGHSSFEQCLAFARHVGARSLVTFHHDPGHTDELLDRLHDEASQRGLPFGLIPGTAGKSIDIGP